MDEDPARPAGGPGDRHRPADRYVDTVYTELRRLAGGLLGHERPDHTLQATALVHEAYLKLADQNRAAWADRAHFLAVAAQAMRRILVDHARARGRIKRGPSDKASLDDDLVVAPEPAMDLVALDDALNRLAAVNSDAARVVELRYFGGLTIEETATVLRVSDSTVEREWRYARAWLYRALDPPSDSGDGR
jgi:RNA polymerase sigma factor (TIGR02999 family)